MKLSRKRTFHHFHAIIIITSDMQSLVWGEPELAHEYHFDVKKHYSKEQEVKYALWRNATS